MRLTVILWLIFSSISIRLNFVYHPRAAILHQRNPILDHDQQQQIREEEKVLVNTDNILLDQYDNQKTIASTGDHENQQKLHVEQQDDESEKQESTDLLKSKFIILTSGDQIKLYPIKSASKEQQGLITADLIDDNNYYIIKPIQLNTTDSQVLEHLPHNSHKHWLISKSKYNLNVTERKTLGKLSKASILPNTSETDEYSYDENDASGWRKPFIIDVDYFVDKNYCNNSTEFCFIVVWLDKNNKLVRYGSMDLMEALKPFESKKDLSKSNAKESVLWLDEFPPIQVYKTISNSDICKTQCNFDRLELFSMVIDKRRKVLHVAFSDGIGPAIKPNKILTGILKTRRQSIVHSEHVQLTSQRVLSFNKYPTASELDKNTDLQNLNVDEETADWLFYFDPAQAGKIYALGIDDQWSNKRGLAADKEAIQSLAARNISLTTDADISSVTNFAFDQQYRRMFLINDAHELLSCGMSGEDLELVGNLSQKPAIRSSYSMKIFRNTLLISDSTKKSLVGVGLDQYNRKLRGLGQQKVGGGFEVTHEVLIVQMNSLYGFRVVDWEPMMGHDLQDFAREANSNLINRVALDIDNSNKVIDYSLTSKFPDGYSEAYSNLIRRSSLFYPDSLDRWRQYIENEYLKQVLGTISLVICYSSLALMLICIYFIRKKRMRDDLYKLQLDSSIQSS